MTTLKLHTSTPLNTKKIQKIYYKWGNLETKESGIDYVNYENVSKKKIPQIKITYKKRYKLLSPNISRNFDKDLEQWLHNWDTIEKLRKYFNNDRNLYITKNILQTYAKDIL